MGKNPTKDLEVADQIFLIPVDRISPDPNQPRKDIDFEDLDDLKASIAEDGLLQAIQVVPDPEQAGHWIIEYGERRWLAHKELGLPDIRATVAQRDQPDFVSQVVENLFRSNLNPIEEALALRRLKQGDGNNGKERTIKQVGKIVGLSEPTVMNRLHLLTLPEEIQQLIRNGKLPSRAGLKLGQFKDLGDAKLIELAHDLIEGKVSVTMLTELRDGRSIRGKSRGKSRVPTDALSQLKRVILLRQRIPAALPAIKAFIGQPREKQVKAYSSLPEPARNNLLTQLPELASELLKLVSVLEGLPVVKLDQEERSALRAASDVAKKSKGGKKKKQVASIEDVRRSAGKKVGESPLSAPKVQALMKAERLLKAMVMAELPDNSECYLSIRRLCSTAQVMRTDLDEALVLISQNWDPREEDTDFLPEKRLRRTIVEVVQASKCDTFATLLDGLRQIDQSSDPIDISML